MDCANPGRAYLLEQIRNNPVLVYSWVNCPYCKKAKETLAKMRIHATIFDLDKMPSGNSILSDLRAEFQQETVPIIFIGGKHIGGNSDLQDGLANGTVQAKLREAGVAFT